MKISLISTSHRKKSQSKRIAKILEEIILNINSSVDCYSLDMFESKVPLWTADRKQNVKFWEKEYQKLQMN